jgi:transcription-repair coupling factor (superfamily II helicase)
MGLAQLYQLRGRVGRGANSAYAYFLHDRDRRLTDTARQRLRTIFEATELGAGFRIAMSDLEIRGAGNLLGPEQSGHIAAVGFDLYTRLLAEAVEELRAQRGERPAPERLEVLGERPAGPSVDLPLPAYLPESYVPATGTRLALYSRLAKFTQLSEVDDFERELRDRFGPPPPAARSLLYLLRVKLAAVRAGVESVASEDGQLVLRTRAGTRLQRAALERAFGPRVKVGVTQVRLSMDRRASNWRELLPRVLNLMASPTGVPAR